MSQEPKVASLKEKIGVAKSNKSLGSIGLVVGGLFIGLGVAFNIIWTNDFTFRVGLSLVILGISLFIFGAYVSHHYTGQFRVLTNEIAVFTEASLVCPNCRLKLPRRNLEHCPFCGESLKPSEPTE